MKKPSFTFLANNGTRKIKAILGCNLGYDVDGKKVWAIWLPNSGVVKFDKECPKWRRQRILNHEVIHIETPLDEDTVEQLERGWASAQKALAKFHKENPDI